MSKYGLKIKKIDAGTLWGYNLGVRKMYSATDAMLCNSLFLDYIKTAGLRSYKDISTRDIICLDFGFGSRSYEEELAHAIKSNLSEDIINNIKANKDNYVKISKEALRENYYKNGVTIKYQDGESIMYKMLYRNASKAKVGQVMFINSELYERAYDWLTMGIGAKKPKKIVELSAYAPLTTSTIEAKFSLSLDNVLILKEQQSEYKTQAKIVYAKNGKCQVKDEIVNVVNNLWDGMALIEPSVLPDFVNGMALLRNHFFKACAFKSNIQLFIKDYCESKGIDYDSFTVTDCYGNTKLAKDIKMITTDSAVKWGKFKDFMGNNPYEYWKLRVGDWGIVKTDHPSKLEDVQQMSYQMVNTLPCSEDDIDLLAQNSIDYVEALKYNERVFEKFLRKNATLVNHYEMMADLYRQNPEFAESSWYRREKVQIIKGYVDKLKSGKITVPGDNLTVCGNPYALLLYAVGDDFTKDPTLSSEDGCIQCYSSLFRDKEFLCAIRNPHNSPNNLAYLHNRKTPEMQRYFEFSKNIIAVNCLRTDIQDRMNGCDFDSDFFFVTNNSVMVKAAAKAYREYPTIVNRLKESGIVYDNTPECYAAMDNKFSKSRIGIGESSNLAQLAMTYYWTTGDERYYDVFVIMSVLAQIIIDGCKREYEVSGVDEIKRIKKLSFMKEYQGNDFPEFMLNTRKVPSVKNGKPRNFEDVQLDRQKLHDRINEDLYCPMNVLVKDLEDIKSMKHIVLVPTKNFFLKIKGKANNKQMSKISEMVEKYAYEMFLASEQAKDEDVWKLMLSTTDEVIENLQKMRTTNKKTINRLIEIAIGLTNKHKSLTILKLLYKANKKAFLESFVTKKDEFYFRDTQKSGINTTKN